MAGEATKRSSSPRRKRKQPGRRKPEQAPAVHRRKRFASLPQPPQKGVSNVPHARDCEFLRALDDGELAALVVGSRAWQETFKAYCDKLDDRKPEPGPDRGYKSWEYEAFLTFGLVAGHRTIRAARRHMTSEEGSSARYLLGFDGPRDHRREVRYRPYQLGKDYRRTMDGVPSPSAISRDCERVDHKTRARLWKDCLRLLIRYHLIEFPEFAEEARLAGIDGITMKSIHTTALYHPKTKEVTNPKRITPGFEGGSSFGAGLPKSKRGHGYLVTVPATLKSRLVLTVPVVEPMPGAESPADRKLIGQLETDVRPYVNWDAAGVLVMDGAYFALANFRAAYRAGYIPQIHTVAHPRGGLRALGLNPDGTPTETEAAEDLPDDASVDVMLREDVEYADIPAKLTSTRDNYLEDLNRHWDIKSSPGWHANGLREI